MLKDIYVKKYIGNHSVPIVEDVQPLALPDRDRGMTMGSTKIIRQR